MDAGKISNQTLDIEEELYACFMDWQKAFDCVNWAKLMQILKGTVIDWWKSKVISKLYMDQSVKTKPGPKGDKKCEEWKKSLTRKLCVVNCIQLVRQISFQ